MLLLDECRAVVRTAPKEAAALAKLVPLALERTRHEKRPWSRVLLARATAHHGNALRVTGDLWAADRIFSGLRRQIEAFSLADADAEAEISSLEASLRIDQRRFVEADRLLAVAAAHASQSLAPSIVVKRGNLLMTMGRSEPALEQFRQAAATFDAESEPHLHLATVTGRVDCLLELDQVHEAARLLEAERAAYLDAGDRHLTALHTFYRARVSLGLGQMSKAEADFTTATQQLLALDRNYDAIVASLYLAITLRSAGKKAELRKLASRLVPLFESRGVEREKLASLRLHAEAA